MGVLETDLERARVTSRRAATFQIRLFAVERYCAYLAAVAVGFVMLAVVADVIMRLTLNQPIDGVLEGSELAMVAMVYLGMAYTQSAGSHMKVDILMGRLRGRRRLVSALTLLSNLVAIGFLALLIWQTGGQAWRSWQIREFTMGVITFPIYPARAIIPFGLFLMVMRLLIQMLEKGRTLFQRAGAQGGS